VHVPITYTYQIYTVMSSNHHPHVSIPSHQEAQQPAVPSSSTWAPPSEYAYRLSPPNPFISQDMTSGSWNLPPLPPRRPQATPMTPTLPIRPRVQSVSEHYPTTTPMSFPEPHLHRTTSHRENLPVPSHSLTHHHSRTELGYDPNLSNLRLPHTNPSVASFASSYAEDDYYGVGPNEVLSSISSLLSPLPNSSVGVRR